MNNNRSNQELKDKIVINVLDYLEFDNNVADKNKALSRLILFAKIYNIKIRRKVFRDKKKALKDFILNESGYLETINNLYNSIL